MAILDTSAGSTVLGPLVGGGRAIRGGTYTVAQLGPVNGNAIPMLTAPLSVTVGHDIGWVTDVEFQLSRDPEYATLDWSVLKIEQTDGQVNALATGLLDESRYYWRARVKESGPQGLWSGWTASWVILIDTGSGRAFGYSEMNFGTAISQVSTETRYVEANVGWLPVENHSAIAYTDENVGLKHQSRSEAFAYAEEGDVSTNTPTPHIWFLKPSTARAGDGVRIFGFGLGDLAASFNGVVEINYPGSRGWQTVNVVNWQTFPADPSAYTEDRVLDPVFERIDMQHQVVEITVPNDAVPPGYGIRIRTEGP